MPKQKPPVWRGLARGLKPMLAVLVDQADHDRILKKKELVFEPKFDGIRAIVEIDGAEVRLFSRLGNDKTAQFPEIVNPLQTLGRRLRRPVVLDGEIVAIDDAGTPLPFQHLQGRIHVRGLKSHAASRATSVALIVFDMLRDGNHDLRPLPFTDRRARLEKVLRRPGSDILRLIESDPGPALALRTRARREGWEGIVAKDPTFRYLPGSRHPSWMKLKFVENEEFVVGGWTAPQGSRSHFGALLLGYYLDTTPPRGTKAPLIFAGQVGSGFTGKELDRVAGLLESRITTASPFMDLPRGNEHGYWVEPTLVAQVKFTQWTLDGVLRNPVYLGMRDDKRPQDVRHPDHRPPKKRTGPAPKKTVMTSKTKTRRAASTRSTSRAKRASGPHPPHPEPNVDALLTELAELERGKKRSTITLDDGSGVAVGNLDKLFWPKLGITKGEFVRFYVRMAPYILPVVADRPLVMKRFPNGVDGKSFYQHRAPDPLPEGLRVADVRESPEKPGSVIPYLVGERLQTILYMAQLAVISQDPWFSRLPDIECADMAALDLDPMPGATFEQVLDIAGWLHDVLDGLGTPSFPKTSGSRGIHIFIPLPPGTPYDAGQIFCQIVATVVASRHPDVATVERMVKKRPKATVYIDFLQNIYGKTLACAYSARASAFAGVSTPLTWDEVHEGVKAGLRPEDFTMRNIFARLDQTGDLWAALRTSQPADLEAVFTLQSG